MVIFYPFNMMSILHWTLCIFLFCVCVKRKKKTLPPKPTIPWAPPELVAPRSTCDVRLTSFFLNHVFLCLPVRLSDSLYHIPPYLLMRLEKNRHQGQAHEIKERIKQSITPLHFTCRPGDHSIDPGENMCCSVLRAAPTKGYLSIPLNTPGAFVWKCASPDDKSEFNTHIYHPQLASAVQRTPGAEEGGKLWGNEMTSHCALAPPLLRTTRNCKKWEC